MKGIQSLLEPVLNQLQFSIDEPALVIDQLPIGYGGQLSRRLLGMKIGLAMKRKAVFLRDDDPPYIQSMERSFATKYDKGQLEAAPYVDLPYEHDFRKIVSFDYFRMQKLLKAENVSVETWVERQLADKYALSTEDFAQLDGWLLSKIRFLSSFEDRLQKDLVRLGISKDTLGVHLRRGDKKVETPYVPVALVNEAILGIYERWPFKTVFLASDDSDAASAIQIPVGTDLIFDTSENRYNNANHKMLIANPSMAAEETYIAFKNLRLLAECGGIVGQDNAHFATIAASHIRYRTPPLARIALLNGNVAKIESRLIGLQYFLKLRIREAVKRMLPSQVIQFINRVSH
ncbi:hypothetical protein ACVWWI_006055 [Bradyrhizobium sp. USDA 3686]|uniref:hypothetical protein n=1 Tax=Bradyrhizobium TaxID=374 RepID=UPI0019568691|nr:hypothetical protein [Bradyrhizobium canariense]MBM7488394.1 hypothetical protein [Bradyrhizobium canariense]UFW71062.1 hypothetical protein BcanWU425_30850 [Bradyrhizobium canariense]